MGRADILSINVGKPKQIRFKHRDVSTGIFKTPVEEPVFLSWANFDGDGQADLVHHGGREKAVCVYPYEHYPFWENELQRKLEFGALGENINNQGAAGDRCSYRRCFSARRSDCPGQPAAAALL